MNIVTKTQRFIADILDAYHPVSLILVPAISMFSLAFWVDTYNSAADSTIQQCVVNNGCEAMAALVGWTAACLMSLMTLSTAFLACDIMNHLVWFGTFDQEFDESLTMRLWNSVKFGLFMVVIFVLFMICI